MPYSEVKLDLGLKQSGGFGFLFFTLELIEINILSNNTMLLAVSKVFANISKYISSNNTSKEIDLRNNFFTTNTPSQIAPRFAQTLFLTTRARGSWGNIC